MKTPTDGSVYALTELLARERFIGISYLTEIENSGFSQVLCDNAIASFRTSSDFLTYECRYPNVIGEPSARLGDAWARRGIDVAFSKVALLMPVSFMTTPKASKLFMETPLVRVYIFSKRLPYRRAPMAWYLWEKGNWTSPKIRWI